MLFASQVPGVAIIFAAMKSNHPSMDSEMDVYRNLSDLIEVTGFYMGQILY
jgi:hypothetical protein